MNLPLPAKSATTALLMVGVGNMGQGYIKAAARCGIYVLVVETQDAIKELQAKYPGVILDTEPVGSACYDEFETWLAPCFRLAARNRVAGVLAFTEPHVIAAAYLQDSLSLPGPSIRAALASRNKAIQRSILDLYGVPQPGWRLAQGSGVFEESGEVGGGPWVVKPLDGMGSHGVVLVSDLGNLISELANRGSGASLVEEYIGGEEFSWEAVVQDGTPRFTNITRKKTGGPPNFVETAHVVGPGVVSAKERVALEELGSQTVAALGVRNSVVHMEAKIDPTGRAVVIETAVRAPGDFILGLVALSTGVDVYELCVRMATGEKVAAFGGDSSAAAIQFVSASTTGVLIAADLDSATRFPGVRKVELRVQIGSLVQPPQASWERLAYVIATADTAESALAVAAAAADTLQVHIEPPP